MTIDALVVLFRTHAACYLLASIIGLLLMFIAHIYAHDEALVRRAYSLAGALACGGTVFLLQAFVVDLLSVLRK